MLRSMIQFLQNECTTNIKIGRANFIKVSEDCIQKGSSSNFQLSAYVFCGLNVCDVVQRNIYAFRIHTDIRCVTIYCKPEYWLEHKVGYSYIYCAKCLLQLFISVVMCNRFAIYSFIPQCEIFKTGMCRGVNFSRISVFSIRDIGI